MHDEEQMYDEKPIYTLRCNNGKMKKGEFIVQIIRCKKCGLEFPLLGLTYCPNCECDNLELTDYTVIGKYYED